MVGRLVQVTEPDGNVRQLHRDPEGNVLEVRDCVGSRRFSNSGMGWLASVEEDGAKVRGRVRHWIGDFESAGFFGPLPLEGHQVFPHDPVQGSLLRLAA
jgi:YD repeat-containing protein